jgi:DNA-binding MarR family transcriptional regulator
VRMTDIDTELLLNDILKRLFHKILRLQEKSVSEAANQNISRSEIHVLEAVQDVGEATLTGIAAELSVSKPTVSVCVKRLVEKGYLKKAASKSDGRKNIISLTKKGEACCLKHKQFHDAMIHSILNDFKIEQYPELLKALHSLHGFFDRLDA